MRSVSGVRSSAEDNGVVVTVLTFVLGVGVAGVGAYFWTTGGGSQGPLVVVGFGGVITLMAASGFYSRLSAIETRDPVVIVRKDLNDWEEIRWDLLKLVGGWTIVLAIYHFVLSASASDVPPLGALVRDPTAVAGWLLVNVVFVLVIMFRSWREKGIGDSRHYR